MYPFILRCPHQVSTHHGHFPPVRFVAEGRITEPIYAETLLAAVVQLIPPGKHPALCREEVQLQPVLLYFSWTALSLTSTPFSHLSGNI